MTQSKFYLLRIELLEVEPKIWREFVVPSDITLDRLHDVVQIIMGWEQSHLYQFLLKDKKYSEFLEYIQEFDDIEDSKLVRLNELINRKNQKVIYEYDFGDGWQHEISLLNSNYKSDYPYELQCLNGDRACPPEDVGGTYGYSYFLKCISDPQNEEYDEMLCWVGGEFESEEFELEYVNFELIKYYNYARLRSLPWCENSN